eukprot:Rmarinus@m.16211
MWLKKMTARTVKELWDTLLNHRSVFVESYGSEFLTSKHHGLDEAARSIAEYGPIAAFETSRHEAKNALAKETVQKGNRRNMPYSFAKGVLGSQSAGLMEEDGEELFATYTVKGKDDSDGGLVAARQMLVGALVDAVNSNDGESALFHETVASLVETASKSDFPVCPAVCTVLRQARSVTFGGNKRFSPGNLVRVTDVSEPSFYVVVSYIFVIDGSTSTDPGSRTVPRRSVYFVGPSVPSGALKFHRKLSMNAVGISRNALFTDTNVVAASRTRYHRVVHAWGSHGEVDLVAVSKVESREDRSFFLTDFDYDETLLDRSSTDYSVDEGDDRVVVLRRGNGSGSRRKRRRTDVSWTDGSTSDGSTLDGSTSDGSTLDGSTSDGFTSSDEEGGASSEDTAGSYHSCTSEDSEEDSVGRAESLSSMDPFEVEMAIRRDELCDMEL